LPGESIGLSVVRLYSKITSPTLSFFPVLPLTVELFYTTLRQVYKYFGKVNIPDQY